ncbi:U2-type spliceosomal complex subunit CWC24 ASCRUDRAFT_17739, partial [Ascoidea rubescens DSM 1968]
NIKSTIITDFQPDICKDFKNTGYCGFGDTCKFLHLRDDFQKGWKLNDNDKEWIINSTSLDNKIKKKIINDKIPFKCPICRKTYKNPIKTTCNHYFCEKCFLDRYSSKNIKKCFICHAQTNGIMFPAKIL